MHISIYFNLSQDCTLQRYSKSLKLNQQVLKPPLLTILTSTIIFLAKIIKICQNCYTIALPASVNTYRWLGLLGVSDSVISKYLPNSGSIYFFFILYRSESPKCSAISNNDLGCLQ